MVHYLQCSTLVECVPRPDDRRGRRHLIVAHKWTSVLVVANSARAPLTKVPLEFSSGLTSSKLGGVGLFDSRVSDKLEETSGRFSFMQQQ